jgi:hypothetical protein
VTQPLMHVSARTLFNWLLVSQYDVFITTSTVWLHEHYSTYLEAYVERDLLESRPEKTFPYTPEDASARSAACWRPHARYSGWGKGEFVLPRLDAVASSQCGWAEAG